MLSSLEEKGLIVRKEHSIILGQIDPPSGQTVAPSGQNVPISKEKSTKKENIIKENKGGGVIAPPPPNYSEVLSFGKEKNIPESVCLGFFSHFTEFHWKHKDGDVVDNWKATLTSWYLREKKSVAKSVYQNVYGQASEQEQAAYAGSQYASYAARKAEEKQADQLRQQNTETKYVSYDDYKKA